MGNLENNKTDAARSYMGENVVFAYAVNEYKRHVHTSNELNEKLNDWVFHTFHSMHLQNPGLFYTHMHNHNVEELMERILKNAATVKKSMDYKLLMPQFLDFCKLKGWSPKADKGENLIQLPPPREYPYRPRKHRNKPEE